MTTHPDFPSLTVEEVLHRWPRTADVFFRHRMACVGCTMAPFESLPEAAGHYGLPADDFVDEIRHAARKPPERSPHPAPPGGGRGSGSL